MTTDAILDAMRLELIDTHCHLDDASFAGDLDEVLADSRAAGVCAWVNVGFEPSRWESTIRLSHRIESMSHMLGVHPGSAVQWSPATGSRLEHLLRDSGARAVGEIGLDFYRDHAPHEVQRRAFVEQLEIALKLELPVVFHMRDAEEEMLDVLTGMATLPRMVFHSFDGSDRLRQFVVEQGAVIGVGGLSTRQSAARLREQLRQMPLSCMMLETDSPYLVPARQKTRRNTPAQTRTVALFLAELLGIEPEEVAETTSRTAEDIFGKLLP